MNPDGKTDEYQALRDAEKDLRTAAITYSLSLGNTRIRYLCRLKRAAISFEKELRKTL
jgi:hypothetical protein